ncbi:ribosomal protein S21e, partial [Gigaspora rosea]
CSTTNCLIITKDHMSIQINIGEVNERGRFTNTYTTYALCGFICCSRKSVDSLNRLATKDGFLK